jgi:hypothetical protein
MHHSILEIFIPTTFLVIASYVLSKITPVFKTVKTDDFTFPIYLLVCIWTLIGFFFNLDNNQEFGCIYVEPDILATPNVVYSTVSLTLLMKAFFTKDAGYRSMLFKSELLLWLYKMLYLKGGYGVGVSASPLLEVVWFDFFGLAFRLLLINQVISVRMKPSLYVLLVFIIKFIKKQPVLQFFTL